MLPLFNFKKKEYIIAFRYHYKNDEIVLDRLFDYVRKTFFVDLLAIGIIQEFTSGEFKPDGLSGIQYVSINIRNFNQFFFNILPINL